MINIQAGKVKITFGRVGKEIGTFDSSAQRERERERERERVSQFVYLASYLSFIPHLA